MNTTNSILKWSIFIGLAVILFIPLYVSNPLYFPFITGKGFAFRIIVEIVLALWLVLVLRERGTAVALTDKSVAPKVNALTIAVSAFTVIALLADLVGVNPLRSIWSNFERMEGWMIIGHLWAYFIVLSSVVGSGEEAKRNWTRVFNITLVAGGITALYGLFQYFGWAATHQGATRVDASLGNSAYMAAYMLINAFLAGYMALAHLARKSLFWTYSVLALFFSFILFQTGTRGSILGWFGAILLSALIYAIWGRAEKGQSNKTRLIAGGVIALFIIIATLFYFNRDAKWIMSHPVLSRIATISWSESKTQARGYIWPMAVRGVFESPKTAIIGIGQENFNYIFNSHYNPKMWSQEQWFDRAHSVFLDWLVAGGLLGLVSYLSLFVIALLYISKSTLTIGQKSLLVGLLAGYAVHNVFVFDNQTSYVMFFTILAFIHSISPKKPRVLLSGTGVTLSEDTQTIRDYVSIPLVVIGVVIIFYFASVRPLQANLRLMTALRACGSGAPSSEAFARALKLNSYTAAQETREQLASCVSSLPRSNLPIEEKSALLNLAQIEIARQIEATPLDARAYILAGSMFDTIGDWESAAPLLEKAHELSPAKQTIAFELITNYLNRNKVAEAVALAKTAFESAPEYELARVAYAATLIYDNKEAQASELLKETPHLMYDPRIINVYVVKKNFTKVIELYKKLIEKEPGNAQAYMSLAVAYLETKQTAKALEVLNTVKTNFPQTGSQIDAIIKDIKEGKDPLK
ncbi:MAG: tetratricopeptide repeat protein [Patescibacteria group bacterium]